MNYTVNVLCYKSKTLANGEHPLMICVSNVNQRKYLSIGVSINPQYWDFKKNKPKRNCPNKDSIQSLINNKISEYKAQILDLKASNKDFTVSNVLRRKNADIKKCTVSDFFKSHIKQLESENRLKYASTFKELEASMTGFNGNLDIYFSDIDVDWTKKYVSWLSENGLNLNSVGVRIRTLRVLYNKALDENLVKRECYPFDTVKVSKLHMETAKRAITKDDVKRIISFSTDNRYT